MMSNEPKTHYLKIQRVFYKAVIDGRKKFEIRINDRGFREGDFLVLQECESDSYTGREVKAQITYIPEFELPDNYIVMGIDPIDRKPSIPRHLANNLLDYPDYLETEDAIDQFMFDMYDTYEAESYATYDEIKAYLNPLTRPLVIIEEENK